MRTRTLKLIIDKTFKKIAREIFKNDTKIKDLLKTIARDTDFKDYALLFSTGSAVGGLLVTIFIKNNLATSDQVEAGIERLFNKIVEYLKNQGLIPQEEEIKTDVVESVNNIAMN